MMNTERPDPDVLLQRFSAEEARSGRGRLKIFFGASAGVGKTYAMLSAARGEHLRGTPLTIGVVETHGRSETEELTKGLPHLSMKESEYRDRKIPEFDLDAALDFGMQHPGGLVLVDELAHSNVIGSRHPKRWQDVEELLAAGINVWTTMNVQHIESLNDIISGITDIRVRETVPDRIFDEAGEVVVVDLPPDDLLERLRQGKVYVPPQAEIASKNFFRKGNLLALRELALRRTADRVDVEMQAYRLQSSIGPVWPNRESLLACVEPGESGEKIVRHCARLAAQLDVPWHALHVHVPAPRGRNEQEKEQVLRVLKLAADLGAVTATISASSAAPAIVRYAREHNLSRLVMGRHRRRWRWPWQRTLAEAVEAEADDLDIVHVAHARATSTISLKSHPSAVQAESVWNGYVAAAITCCIVTLLTAPLLGVFELTNIVMLFLLVVVGIALRFGRGPAVLASFMSVALFDFFFVSPQFSLVVSDIQYLVTFTVMLVVALVIGQLTAGLKVQAEAAMERERRIRGLYEMSRDLSAVLMVEQVAQISARFLAVKFNFNSALLVADAQDHLQVMPGATVEVDMAVAQWSFTHGREAGWGTDTLPASKCLILPLKATMRLRGVLAIDPVERKMLSPEQRRVLDTCASLLAISIERLHYIEVAQNTVLQVESERLRNSLLSAISHDMRTPLASLVGLADMLLLTKPPLSRQHAELVNVMRSAMLRMNALVNNLLDMARLESGIVQLNRQWQPLEEVIGSALTLCMQMLEGRPLQVRLAPELPLLNLDAVLIERVLVNLFENAAKYTPTATPIELDARVEGEQVVMTLDDHGPGLPPGREEAIFDKFERIKKEGTTPGIGLGLAICRAIMEAHGGTIRGENREAGGARFILTLPLGEPPENDGTESVDGARQDAEGGEA